MWLVREAPNERTLRIPWDDGAIRRYKFDSVDIEVLNGGEVLWRGDTAFSLEEGPLTAA